MMLSVIYLASVTAPLAQFKVPPLASWLVPAFNMNAVSLGMQMSAIGIMGMILAFPAAHICRSLGAKNTVLLSVGCVGMGSLGGAFSTTFAMLMMMRLLEGVGIGLVGVSAPTCVSIWFTDKSRGTALGLWSTWMPLSMIVVYRVAPAIADAWGWRFVYILCAAVCIVAFILFAIFFRLPSGKSPTFAGALSTNDMFTLMKNRNIWLLGIDMMVFMTIGTGVLGTYYNTYLVNVHGFSDMDATFMVSIRPTISLIGGPLVGVLFDHIPLKRKRWLTVSAFILYIGALWFAWPAAGKNAVFGIWIFTLLSGMAASVGGSAIRPFAPIILRNGAAGAALGMAILQFMQNVGVAFGTPFFGYAIERVGWWGASAVILLPLCCVAIIAVMCIGLNKE